MKRKLGLVLLSILLLSSILAGCKSKEVYRLIKVNSFEGEISMNRAEEVIEMFEGIQLISNDKVTTGSDGLVELLVDSDKNIVASADTCFAIEAVGDETQGKVYDIYEDDNDSYILKKNKNVIELIGGEQVK